MHTSLAGMISWRETSGVKQWDDETDCSVAQLWTPVSVLLCIVDCHSSPFIQSIHWRHLNFHCLMYNVQCTSHSVRVQLRTVALQTSISDNFPQIILTNGVCMDLGLKRTLQPAVPTLDWQYLLECLQEFIYFIYLLFFSDLSWLISWHISSFQIQDDERESIQDDHLLSEEVQFARLESSFREVG